MKKTIELSLEKAKELYGKNPEMDQLLLANFTEDELTKKDWRDLKTVDDCYAYLNTWHIYQHISETNDEYAYRQLKVIIKAINQGWTPDWNNSSQYKYYPWFEVTSGGVEFSYSGYYCASTSTRVGSRLCFESSEKCKYAATQFVEIYKQFLL